VHYVSEGLADSHDLAAFHSGKPELDTWLRESATHVEANRTGRTFVWHAGDQRVVAYFTLAAHLLRRADLPRKLGRGSPDAIPAVLLARLALDKSLHGQGLGGELLHDALSRAVHAAKTVAARLVVTDAIDEEAAAFYQRYGFQPVPTRPDRLVRKMSDIARSLGSS